MGPTIIARNYAETLLALARREGGDQAVDTYGSALEEVAELLRREPRIREFLETPRVSTDDRKRAIRATFGGRVPEPFLRFLLVVLDKRRQALLGEIAQEYTALVDALRGRVRARITLAREGDAALREEIVRSLEQRLGKTVVATFASDPALIGGVVIRVGDQLYDGSLRRRIGGLRRRMMKAGTARS
jgi:F-type H+-transporting ATPase subunit delta